MKRKLLAVAGALISLVVSACAKSITHDDSNKNPTSAQSQGDDSVITVEDFSNNIKEYDEYDISYVDCTEYGVIDPTYDVCGNAVYFPNDGGCGYQIKERYSTKDTKQCERITDEDRIGECVESPERLKKVPHEKRKYSVSIESMDVNLIYCDSEERQNKKQSIKALVRKECLIQKRGSNTDKCECRIVKDNCGNQIRSGITYPELTEDVTPGKDEENQTNKRCLGHVGKIVSCNNPEFSDF